MRALTGSRPTAGAGATSPAPPLLVVTPAAAAAAGMAGEVQLQPAAAAAGAGAGGSDAAGFDSDMVIVLAALLCVLVCALGLNALIHHCIVLDFGRATLTAAVAAAPAAATAAAGGAATEENTGGLKKRELGRIPVVVYEGSAAATDDDCCAICLGEFDDGEKVRVLPTCHHGFHVQCIDLWLAKHPSCPTCRNSLLVRQGCRRHATGDGDGEATLVAGDET